jgi:hypothetical protein
MIMVAVIWLMPATGDRNICQVRSAFVVLLASKWKRDKDNERRLNRPACIMKVPLELKYQVFKSQFRSDYNAVKHSHEHYRNHDQTIISTYTADTKQAVLVVVL